jgi:3,4-dihydroxy 2-butanone 4-phosphate synthase/GTP cyclohydrolase II
VTLTYAQSLDGSISAVRGKPLPLSGPESARLTHRLRAAHDAILVGIGTVLADDPRLDVRHVEGRNPQPVILDSRLRIPLNAKLLQGLSGQDRPPLIATTERASEAKAAALEASGARVLCLPSFEDGRVSLPGLMQSLKTWGVGSLMVEGGARVITSFLRRRLVDFILLTIAPILVGGLRAVEGSHGSENSPMGSPFPRIRNGDWTRLGEDLVFWGEPVWPAETTYRTA